jgi:hypothetical protein
MNHSIESAMKRGELTEEEAYFVLRFAGHCGYKKAMQRLKAKPLWKRALTWLLYVGGWAHPELSQWDRGAKAIEIFRRDHKGKLRIQDPTPISFCGHRFTHFGNWFQIRIKRGVIVVVNHEFWRGSLYAYWSNDGTPPHEDKIERGHRGRYFFKKTWVTREEREYQRRHEAA